MNLASAFAAAAEKNGSRIALFWGDTQFTYNQLWEQTCRCAAYLQQELGVQPRDRVGLWLKNCPEFVPALFGILQAGATVVPINNFLKPDEVNFILGDSGCQVLITDLGTAEAWPKLKAAQPQLQCWPVEDFHRPGALPEASAPVSAQSTSQDLALIIYTSGTTGRPKGAMLSHGNLLHNVDSCRQVLAAVEADRFAVVLPMFHSFMMTVSVLLPLIVGGSMVLVRSLHPPKNILHEIFQHGATILPAVPSFFRMLANAAVSKQLPLRVCISGGAPLPAQILIEFNQKMAIPLIEGYGLSEASPVASLNPVHGPWKAGSIGVPIPGVEMSVQDESGQVLEAGKTGEICVRGGNVMMGYWNQPEETALAIRQGWLLTGDLGHRDGDGYYYVTDRKKDMLLVNGINVYPREIEEILYQFPGVKEAAVVGVPDQRRGEQPVAFVVSNEDITVEERALLQFVREKLADYKVPKRVVFMAGLPRNATGKILKTALRQTVT